MILITGRPSDPEGCSLLYGFGYKLFR